MNWLDWVVIIVYFLAMAGIGVWAMRRVKGQEDYFMGGRGFGKIMQTFAAFGSGTGAADPVNTASTTVRSGMSGMWSIMSWLFVTPFYWITGVWYRRMRHLTLGDWYVERYQSRALGAAYTIFGLIFYMVFLAMFFAAVAKVAAPLMGDTMSLFGAAVRIEYVLVPIISIVVIVYGVLGGLTAAYWTDLIQGVFIIILSILLIPFGLSELSEQFGDGAQSGFQVMHERLDDSLFAIVGSTRGSQFPFYMIAAVALISLVGVAVMPHFIATGGGSAKTEKDARIGLVTGNFFKRFCTIGWAITAMIVLALYAGTPALDDPDKAWGIASRELLPMGLRGLMLACLLAALMSSADCYMLVCSALVVRNLYVPYVNPKASDKQCVYMGRCTGAIVIVGAVVVALLKMDVVGLLVVTWEIPMLMAAAFWIGMVWRRATLAAVWGTMIFVALSFWIIPFLVPLVAPELRTNQSVTFASDTLVMETTRKAAIADVAIRDRAIEKWEKETASLPGLIDKESDEAKKLELSKKLDTLKLKGRPEPLVRGQPFTAQTTVAGKAVFWLGKKGKLVPVDADGNVIEDVKPKEVRRERLNETTIMIVKRYDPDVILRGSGHFEVTFLPYQWLGMDLKSKSNAALSALKLFPKVVIPFLVMIFLSLLTKRTDKAALDRFYVKMKTPVDPDPEKDKETMAASYANPTRFDDRKLFTGSDLEVVKPTLFDVLGFIACFLVCFAIIGFAVFLASIGS